MNSLLMMDVRGKGELGLANEWSTESYLTSNSLITWLISENRTAAWLVLSLQHISSRRHKDRVAGKPSKPKYSPYNKQQRSSVTVNKPSVVCCCVGEKTAKTKLPKIFTMSWQQHLMIWFKSAALLFDLPCFHSSSPCLLRRIWWSPPSPHPSSPPLSVQRHPP